MKLTSVLLGFGLCMQGCVHAGNESAAAPATRPVLEQYLEVSLRPPSAERAQELEQLDETFLRLCMLQPAWKGWAEGIVTDDRGLPLQGVEVEVRWHEPMNVHNLADRPVDRSKMVVDGKFAVPLRHHHGVALTFRKAGYADAGWWVERGRRIRESRGTIAKRLDVREASHIEPRTDGGPGVRVVMGPASYEWDPPGNGQRPAPDRAAWPKQVPQQAEKILSSDALRSTSRDISTRVTTAGTYVATDKDGKVVDLVRLLRGNAIGFGDTDPKVKAVKIAYIGNDDEYALEGAPYSWYLYSVAIPVYPDTEPATPKDDWSKLQWR
jgi:hypothetical protein